MDLEVTLKGHPKRQSSWQVLFKDTLRSKIGLVDIIDIIALVF